MAWRMYKRPRGSKQVPYPMVTIGKSGVFLNQFAMNMLKGAKTVVLFFDEAEGRLGMWFFKDHIDKSAADGVYNIMTNKHGNGQINCSKLLRDESWLNQYLNTASGRKSFALMRDNSQETKNDFYVADLKGSL